MMTDRTRAWARHTAGLRTPRRRSRRPSGALVIAACVVAAWTTAGVVASTQAATPTTVAASADAYVQSDLPTSNFGTAASISVRAVSDTKPAQTAYVRFTVTGLTEAPASAQLQLYSYASSSTGIQVRTADSGWSESGITYANAPSAGSALVSTMAPLAVNTWAGADVSAVVTGNGTYTFALSTTSQLSKQFASR